MPIIKSALKRARQSVKRRSHNLQIKRLIKHDVSALSSAITEGDSKQIQAKLAEAYSQIDRAAKSHTIHKNTAARRKSQLAHQVAKATGVETAAVETKTTKGAGKKAAAGKTSPKKAPATTKPAASKAPTTKKPVAKKAPAAKKPSA